MAASGSVSDFYRQKSVFITGGTGSLGKILIEKLLRSCPEISQIYLLVRPTKRTGSSASERLSNLLNLPIFDKLRQENADIFGKIVMVQGDLNLPTIGLSEIDRVALIDIVSIVFHCASVVKFDSPLEDIISSNVFGTLRLLQLCKQMKKIEAFLYVSTLYSTCNHTYIKERLPQISHLDDFEDFTGITEKEFVNTIPKDLVDQWPNAYTFSKAVTEVMLDKFKDSMPMSIVRPSMIISTLREPIPGWIDNFYGPTLMICNSGLGFIRSLHIEHQNTANIIPADVVVNLLICVGWKTAKEKFHEMKIYNCCCCERNAITWRQFTDQCRNHAKRYPSKKIVRYPHTIYTSFYSIYWIISAIQAYLIAYIRLMVICDYKMLRIQKSATRLWGLTSFFPNHEWMINDDNVVKINDQLDDKDKEKFLIDVGRINWSTYLENYVKGIRIHLLKDSMDSVDEGRARLNTLFWREILLQLFLLAVIIVPVSVIVRLVMY